MPGTRFTVSVFEHNGEYCTFLAEGEESVITLHQNFRIIYESPITMENYYKIEGIVKRANIERMRKHKLLEKLVAAEL